MNDPLDKIFEQTFWKIKRNEHCKAVNIITF